MMKKTGPVFSLLLVCFAGMLIFTGVFYLEKKEKHQKEEEAGQEKEKEEETLPKEDIVGEVVVGDTQGESVPLEETLRNAKRQSLYGKRRVSFWHRGYAYGG